MGLSDTAIAFCAPPPASVTCPLLLRVLRAAQKAYAPAKHALLVAAPQRPCTCTLSSAPQSLKVVSDCPELLAAVLAGTPGRTAYVLVRNVSLAACWPAGGVAAPGSLTLLGLPDHTVVLDLAGLGAAFRLVRGGPGSGAPAGVGPAAPERPHCGAFRFQPPCHHHTPACCRLDRTLLIEYLPPVLILPTVSLSLPPGCPQAAGSTVSLRYMTLTGLSRQQLAVPLPAADAGADAGGALVAAPTPQSVLSRSTASLWGFCFDRWGRAAAQSLCECKAAASGMHWRHGVALRSRSYLTPLDLVPAFTRRHCACPRPLFLLPAPQA